MKSFFCACNKNHLYGLLLLVLLINVVIQAYGFGFSFFSLWDESYLLLKCKEAYSGALPKSNLWHFFGVKWFPYLDLTNKIQSSWASLILVFFAVLNATIVACSVFDKRNVVKYFSIFLMAMLPTIMGHYAAEMPNRMGWGTELNYVVIESFLLWGSLSAFVFYYFNKESSWGYLALFVVGVFCGLAIFVILPSTSLVLTCYFALLVVFNRKTATRCVKVVACFCVGICAALLYVHFFIADLGVVWVEMNHTAHYITKSGLGYTPLSYIGQVDGLLFVAVESSLHVFVIYLLARHIEKKHRGLGGLVYVLFIVFALVFLQPRFRLAPASLLFFSIVFLPYFETASKIENNNHTKIEWFMTCFLVLFPLLASIGTNTPLYGRISCFLCSWVFLWLIREEYYKDSIQWYIVLGAILALLLPISYNNVRTYYHHHTIYTTHFTNGTDNATELSMTPAQKEYFERIHALFDEYGYKPNESVVFAAYLDYCTVYVFDAKLSNTFHMPGFYPFEPKENFLLPDFIILSEGDNDLFHLESFSWGWPDEYDRYYIGSPETVCQKFIGVEGKNRWLYCRKK